MLAKGKPGERRLGARYGRKAVAIYTVNPSVRSTATAINQAFLTTPCRNALFLPRSLAYSARFDVLAKRRLYQHAASLDVFELDLTGP